jgi:hypothetical protein
MDDQLDNDLKNHIKEVFDNFEDTSADEGWLLLKEKFPVEQSNRRGFVWLWWGAAAAIILLFSGIGLWVFNNKPQPGKLIVKKETNSSNQNIAAVKPQTNTVAKQVNKVKDNNIAQNTAIQPNQNKTFDSVSNKSKAAHAYAAAQGQAVKHTGTNQPFAIKNKADSTYNSLNKLPAQQLAVVIKPQVQNNQTIVKPAQPLTANAKPQVRNNPSVTQSIIKPTQPLIANNKPQVQQGSDATTQSIVKPSQTLAASLKPSVQDNGPATSVVIKPSTQTKTTGKTIDQMFADDNRVRKPDPKSDETLPSKRVHFGVYAATYFNYAKGSDNEVNVGGGVSTDIRINKNLKLVTGVAIAQNSLNYNGSNPTSTSFNVAQSFVVPAASTNMYMALSTPTVKNYNASLVGLDVPVNLKYEFNPQKSDAYFSAGLSSGTFINESYTYKYNYPSLASPTLQKTQDESSSKSFSNFYFAKTLNVAFGVGYPFGKNRLVIEPFLKYPLDGLGAQNIRFGAGGVNLKFNFITPRK